MKNRSLGRKVASVVVAGAMTATTLAGCGAGNTNQTTAAATTAAAAEADTKAAEGGVSGTFEGTAVGMGGESSPVKVTLTLEDGKIKDVAIVGEKETPGIGSKAIEDFPAKMIEGNTVTVDAISGATITSKAIVEAATAALAEAGLKPEDLESVEVEAAAAQAEDMSVDADVVVVGMGGAGMTAAITAADAGKSVVILESQAMGGGNTVRSTGGLNAAGTEEQKSNEFTEADGVEKTLATAKEKWADNETITKLAATVQQQWDAYQAAPEGYFDSAELMALDTIIGGHGINDPELLMTLTENSAGAITWLKEHGADLPQVGAAGGASVKRIHRPVDDKGKTAAVGAYIVPILTKNVEDRGIDVYYNTTANKILMEDGKAVGVVAEGETGNTVTVNAKAVILATGGFGGNAEMVEQYRPDLKGFVSTNADGAKGQGITMATADDVKADTVDLDQIQIHPTVHVDPDGNAHLITEGVRGDGAILVNMEGKRFYDEVSTRDKVSAAEIEQTDGSAWLILDQKMIDNSAVYKGYLDAGYGIKGETYEELAEAIGVPADAFKETMEGWAKIWADKKDEEFGRTSFSNDNDLATAPYYAILVTPGIHHTMGGLKIDTATEVINTDGQVIPGLFAAGEVTGGVHGGNRLGGTAVTDIIVFGEIAGNSAVAYIG
ncbi:flavocytochrome c [Oribacterium sp. WCC10]|uniref:flavocytochrome c n=1 Tax=Oribacterium sp. WCC10 TaxID=1855343 RepID=UPI0008DFE8F4|nr:flavocytochrome c [Oribacterium sp. WCC10]SFG68832.1 fumarate reductase flavoprotein subunit [Oribacterium sp. WCC10]